MKRLFTITLLAFGCALGAQAQNGRNMNCGTDKAWKAITQQHPEYEERRKALDAWSRNFAARVSPAVDNDCTLVIPVVVHVMHNFGPENVSQAQIEDAIRVINEDYQFISNDTGRISATFKPIAAKINFKFRLARLDPNGNCTIGVTRHITTLTDAGDDNLKAIVRWPNTKYMNVWVCKTLSSGAGAYAYYPGISDQLDGIVTRADQFGSIGASPGGNFSSRTLTHEIGHYFNLAHVWGNSNDPGAASNCNMDDGVADTPNTVGTADQGCHMDLHTCGEALPDNVENYMDYSNCTKMFTLGQKARVRAAAFGSLNQRSNLWSPANLIATGTATVTPNPTCAPHIVVAPFNFKVCPDQEVRLTVSVDGAAADQVAYLWELPGSATPTSTVANPRVTYPAPGVYPVRLKISNPAGADSVVLDSTVFVRNPRARYAPGDSETFAGASFPSVSDTSSQVWELERSDTRAGWVRNMTYGFSDNGAMYANSRILSNNGVYSVITPAFDLSTLPANSYLVFRYASAKRTAAANDEFRIYTSLNCGAQWATWTAAWTRTSTPNVYTQAATMTGVFQPSPNDFVERKLNIGRYVGRNSVRFKFELTSGTGGNGFYLDNVKVVAGPTAISDRELLKDISIAPNPASTLVQVELPSWPEQKPVSYELISPLGQHVLSGRSEGNRFLMDVSSLAKGVYLLSLEGQKLQRIVVD